MSHNALEKFKAPAIIDLGGNQALLYDSQHSCDLPGVNHLGSITGEERLEELHETGDTALLLPACGREEEWEEGTIFGWHVGDMCFQHLSKNLENVRDILCKAMSILGDKIVCSL
jgi:hypothetical protein